MADPEGANENVGVRPGGLFFVARQASMPSPWTGYFWDATVVAAYLVIVIWIGRRAAWAARGEEGFFLAGRRLGKLYQFFLNFGNSTDANSAVSVCSLVYQQGVPGVWLTFQTVFMNPYYWFMNLWFRRARLVTTADLFEDRFGDAGLGVAYVVSQLAMAVIFIGFANYIGYRIVVSIVPAAAGLSPLPFYAVYTGVVGIYLISGGMTAIAWTETFQGLLVVLFSVILVPFGLHRIGGWTELGRRVPAAFFQLFGSSARATFTPAAVGAILLVSFVQVNAMMSNMGISGSARDEFTARFGSGVGLYAKRVIILFWALTGLLGVAILRSGLVDPDDAWGELSRRLLPPGLLGLMICGILAANMSVISNQALAVSALVVRNAYRRFRPRAAEADAVRVGRLSVAAVLALGVAAGLGMRDVAAILETILLVNVPFGAAILLLFFWRRLNAAGVWVGVVGSSLLILVLPALLPCGPGQDRFAIEIFLLGRIGVHVSPSVPGQALAARFLFDALLPFILCTAVSLATRPTDPARVARFFGKMKTPVEATPELDREAMRRTEADPARFDHLKLWPRSAWEFTRWNRTDAAGFLGCCAATAVIIAGAWLCLRSFRG